MSNQTYTLAAELLSVRNFFKMYHWSTKSYARHVATCSFVAGLDALVDKIIETYTARHGRPQANQPMKAPFATASDADAIKMLNEFADFLSTGMNKFLTNKDTDIANLRDELLGLTHQTLYLFTFE